MLKKKFYDTSSLLEAQDLAFNENFLISQVTLEEIENIKTSTFKDENIKFKARKLLHLLENNRDKFVVVGSGRLRDMRNKDWDYEIIQDALEVAEREDIIFLTQDLSCSLRAAAAGLCIGKCVDVEDTYTGYIEFTCTDTEKMNELYEQLAENKFDLLDNQYIVLKNELGAVVDCLKWKNNEAKSIIFPVLESERLGKIKPKDPYQTFAIDSLKTNKLTVLRGAAGTGKSLLSMGYLLQQLEDHKIDKIIIFCNTVATKGSAKLGYYPGSKNEKLLDSQIGHFLAGKLGGLIEVERLIKEEKLLLIPMSDCRGYDTTGTNAGIYVTEAQNMSVEMMKLLLQRIGDDCICILDGDDKAQVDMEDYAGHNNGLARVSKVFRGQPYYGEVTLKNCYRSEIAKRAEMM